MSLSEGTKLGSYEITGQIGAGGMGEVYRATDSKLGREVAIKTLPAALASDEDRLARFEREAKLLAALNHPHIASIYSLDEHEGTLYLAMELVEGETLEEKLKPGALPVDDALRLALQIAEALEAAHDKGVVHRDLKPANVMVTKDGVVKVLDFGLAKAFSEDPSQSSPDHSPALSLAMTQQGLVLGTAGYMSPEQASGQATDQRADIWAFGVVLYEMLTGLPLFSGESVPHILADVLKSEPNWSRLPDSVNSQLQPLLKRCLAKKPRSRWHSIADVRIEVETLLADPEGANAATEQRLATAPRRAAWPAIAATALISMAIGGFAFWSIGDEPPSEIVGRFPVTLPRLDLFREPQIAPDSQTIAFIGRRERQDDIYLRHLDELNAVPLRGTEGARPPITFSPDGEWVGFMLNGRYQKVPRTGGVPISLCDCGRVLSASWSPDDTILITNGQSVGTVPGVGGVLSPIDLSETGLLTYDDVSWATGGRDFLVAGFSGATAQSVYRWDSTAEELRLLIENARSPIMLSTGHLAFLREGSIWAVPFDSESLEPRGEAIPVVENIAGVQQGAVFSVSNDGTLLYRAGDSAATNREMVWVNRDGSVTPIAAPLRPYSEPNVSPDGTRIAVTVGESENSDIWIWDVVRETLTRLTTDAASDTWPQWTPDSERVVFLSGRDGGGLFSRAADRTGDVVRLFESNQAPAPYTWTENGQLVISLPKPGGVGAARDIFAVPDDAGGTPEPILMEAFHEQRPAISPDGRWLAYGSGEAGQNEIFLRPFPDVETRRWQISTNGGEMAQWSPDGRELFYLMGDRLMVVEIGDDGPAPNSNELFDTSDFLKVGAFHFYSVSADGQRFLFLRSAPQTDDDSESTPELVTVVNWFEELNERVPVD